ncbi:MAG TPA: M1 family aminopeptidase [Anaerolineales bacterium]|jgi:hypothetical protein
MKPLRRHYSHLILLTASFFLLSSCSSALASTTTSTDPQPTSGYVLVTPNPQITATPFQPSAPTDPPPTETALPTSEPPTSTPQPVESPTEPPAVPTAPSNPPATSDRPQYFLTALLDYEGHTLNVSEIVTYPNRSAGPLSNIVLAVNPNLWNGVFTLQSVSVNDQAYSNYSLAGQWFTLNLDKPLESGQAIKIGLGYLLTLPYSSAKFENFGYTARQTNLTDWYPFVVPYINGQWVLPDPYPYGENLVYDKADIQVRLSFANPASAPVVAASAPSRLEDGALVYDLPNARNFTISASPDFLMSSADANGVTIYNYYFASNANAAAMVLELTRMAVNTYTTEFGPYPHSALSVAETDLNDGLETDGLYFLASSFYSGFDGSVRNNLSTIAVHETAHQWWYGAVANNQAVEPWLDEAMATYSEHIFYEDNYPDLLNWWWNFRIYSHGATGWVDSRVYDTSSFRGYVSAVYFNGAQFIQSLRDRIGEKVFFDFIRDYFARNNGRIATSGDFFAVLDLHTSVDISDLLQTYFYYRSQ